MRAYIITLLLVAAATLCPAQSAKVIALDPQDAAHVKSIYDKLAAAEKEKQEMLEIIKFSYVTQIRASACIGEGCTPPPLPEKTPAEKAWDAAWACGFEFSDDYKFIVPKACSTAPSAPSLTTCPMYWGAPTLTNNSDWITPVSK